LNARCGQSDIVPRMRAFASTLALTLLTAPGFGSEPSPAPPGPIHLDRGGEQWAERTLRKLSREEKVGQLFMIWTRARFFNTDGPEYAELRDRVRRYHIGSVAMSVPVEAGVLLKTGPYEAAMLLNQLQADSKLPLLVAADFERGVGTRIVGSTVFPHAMAFGAAGRPELAEAFGRITAEEARALGVHWNFFPVADVNSNPKNPIINTRSFGEDPKLVGDMLAAHIRGARAGGLLTTAKHFPGHGDTDSDSHFGVARVGGDRARLESVELLPFRRAIEAGVDSVMVAHVTAPALEPDPNRVSTTSPLIVTDLLKNKLGFKGLVVTDAMDMAGLTALYADHLGREAVDAFQAGNDLLLIPADLDASYGAVLEAVRSGEITAARLDESVGKILRLKAALGLPRERRVEVARIATRFGRPENVKVGQDAADAAITLVRDSGKVLPLAATATATSTLPYSPATKTQTRALALIFANDFHSEAGRVFEMELRSRIPEAAVIEVDSRSAAASAAEVLEAVVRAQTVIAAVYAIPEPGQAAQKTDAMRALLQEVLDRAKDRTVVIAMGSPYVATGFPATTTYLCTFSDATVSERSAVKALFGEIPIHGRLPVTIPQVAERGTGLDRDAKK
jgi:beta-N-acetylhexosaminidase